MFFHGPDITFLWSKTAEKGDIWDEFAKLSVSTALL
jgi:hypothetical protein